MSSNPGLLPPRNFWLSLPALTQGEAEQLLYFVDALRDQLWEAYGPAVTEDIVDDHISEAPDPDDDLDF